MQNTEKPIDDPFKNEISLFDVLYFLKENWKSIVGGAAIGLTVSIGFLAIVKPRYEAVALIEMAQVNNTRNNNKNNNKQTNNAIAESPALLLERLKLPSTYTPKVINSCDTENTGNEGEALAKMVSVTIPKGLISDTQASAVQVKVQATSKETATECLTAIFQLIQEQQANLLKPLKEELQQTLLATKEQLREAQRFVATAEKTGLYETVYLARRDETFYLMQEISELERALQRDRPTRLVSPIFTSSKPVFPKRGLTMLLGGVSGLLTGLLFALGRKAFAARRAASMVS